MTPFDDVPQRACEGSPFRTQHNLHHTGHIECINNALLGYDVRLGLTQA